MTTIQDTYDHNILAAFTKQEQQDIINNWGFSSVMLKNYLKRYDKTFNFGYAEKFEEGDVKININSILRYTKSPKQMLFGPEAVHRLRIAMKAKAYIMGCLGDLDHQKFIFECLHLFLRINSIYTKYNYTTFANDVESTYKEVLNLTIKKASKFEKDLSDMTSRCKPKRVQIKYHYSIEDFTSILDIYNHNRKEAYSIWLKDVYPGLLESYKNREFDKYVSSLIKDQVTGSYISNDLYKVLTDNKKKELDQLKINKLSYDAFCKTIIRLKKNNIIEDMQQETNYDQFIQIQEETKVNPQPEYLPVSEEESTANWQMLMADMAKYNSSLEEVHNISNNEPINEPINETKSSSVTYDISQDKLKLDKTLFNGGKVEPIILVDFTQDNLRLNALLKNAQQQFTYEKIAL